MIKFVTAIALALSFQQALNAAEYPQYERVQGVYGNLSSVGSDTLLNIMTKLAEKFRQYYPGVNIQIQGAGSSTAPPALIEGASNFGPMSREMKTSEISAFENKFGYEPTKVAIGIDALAVFVNRNNPVQSLNMQMVDAIFSSTRSCGARQSVNRWRQVGVSGSLGRQSVQLYGRNSASGTYGYFKKVALCEGDYSANVNEQPGSASVVQSVASSINGIGYSGIGYVISGVKAINIETEFGSIAPNAENAINGSYPLARLLYLYVNKPPTKDLSPLEREFLRLLLSEEGQDIVAEDGYIPLPAEAVVQFRSELGL